MGKRHEKLSTWKRCTSCGRRMKAKFDDKPKHDKCYPCYTGSGSMPIRDVAMTFDAKAGKMSVYMVLGKVGYLTTFKFSKPVKQLRPTQVGHLLATQLEQAADLMRNGNAMIADQKPVLELKRFKPAS